MAVVLLGVLLGGIRYISIFPAGWNLDRFAGPAPVSILGTVASDPSVNQHRVSFLMSAYTIQTHYGDFGVRGTTQVLVHGAALPSAINLRFGNEVYVSGLLQTVMPVTNPGEFDWRTHLQHRGISGELVVQRPRGLVTINSPGPAADVEDWANRTAHRFEGIFVNDLPGDEAGLLSGILLGDRHHLSPELIREFAATGTSHVLATAGLHVGILSICLAALAKLFPISRKSVSLLVILSLWAFAALAGDRPAVLRAVLVASIYFGGRVFDRVPDVASSLAAAALIILTIQPLALFESDFQMSFLTVLGIAIYLPLWDRLWEEKLAQLKDRRYRPAAAFCIELIGLSMIAQFAAAPLTVYYFGVLSLLSLPVNMIVVPLLFLVIPSGAATLLLAQLWPSAAAMAFKFLVGPVLSVILTSVEWFSRQKCCSVSLEAPSVILLVCIYVAIYSVGMTLSTPKRQGSIRPAAEPSAE